MLLSDGEQKRLGLLLEQYASASGLRVRVKGRLAGGSAAENGAIRNGDVLIRVDGSSVCAMEIDEVTRMIAQGDLAKAPPPAKQISSKPCGIGLTVLDHPPHLVTDISRGGPLSGSHVVLKGDQLVAIGDEFVADATMEEVVEHVVGPEGSEVTVWLERARAGAQSFGHHEKDKADAVRGQLRNLKTLLRDGLLDPKTYRKGVEQCWKGCYSVTVRRGLKYSGGVDVCTLERPTSWDQKAVRLTFFREASNQEYEVLLPRPPPAPTQGHAAALAVIESADAAETSGGDWGGKAPPLTARKIQGAGDGEHQDPSQRSTDGSANTPKKPGGLERMLLGICETQNKIARDQHDHQDRIRETRERRHRAEMQMQKPNGPPLYKPPTSHLRKTPLSPSPQSSYSSNEHRDCPSKHSTASAHPSPQRSTSSSSQQMHSSPHQPQQSSLRPAEHPNASPHQHSHTPASHRPPPLQQDYQASPQQPQRANNSVKPAGQQQLHPQGNQPLTPSSQHPQTPGRQESKPSPEHRQKENRFDPKAVHAVVAFVGTGDKLGLGLLQKGNAILVSDLTDDGTAHKSDKICVGDELLQIDELVTAGLDVPNTCGLIADGEGAHVTLTLGRPRRPGGKGYSSVFKVVLPRPGRGDRSPGVCKCMVCSSNSLGETLLPPMDGQAPLSSSRAQYEKSGEERTFSSGRPHDSLGGGHSGNQHEPLGAHYSPESAPSYQQSVGYGHDHGGRGVLREFMRKTAAPLRSVIHGLTTPRVPAERPMDGLLRTTIGILMASDDTDSRHNDVLSDGRWREDDEEQRSVTHVSRTYC